MSHSIPPRYEFVQPPPVARTRELARTPSPTPSEERALHPETHAQKQGGMKKRIIIAVVIALLVVFMIYKKRIIHWLEPAADWMHRTPGGFLIPIAILIVLSIPPLFGHELVVLVIGLTWGPGLGMAIASAGTLIGEIGTFYLFRTLLRRRAARYEEKNLDYAVLARVIRDGGIVVATVARYSIIPNHLLTALFSTCGISLWTFLVSAVVSLPLQFVNVYLGYALKLQADGRSTKTSNIVNDVDIAFTVLITIAAGRYIRHLQDKARPVVIYERRKRRQADLVQCGFSSMQESGSTVAMLHAPRPVLAQGGPPPLPGYLPSPSPAPSTAPPRYFSPDGYTRV